MLHLKRDVQHMAVVELGYWNTPAGVSWGDKNDGGNPDNIMTMTWEEAMNGGLTVDAKRRVRQQYNFLN